MMSNDLFDRVVTVYDSSNVSTLRYSILDKKLEVSFADGSRYRYLNVDLVAFRDIAGAESVGSTLFKYRKSGNWPTEKVS